MEKYECNAEEVAEIVWKRFQQQEKAVTLIDEILMYLKFQEKPVITDEMIKRSYTGGQAELERENAQYQRSLKVPKIFIDNIERELKRTKARLEWGWGFGFVPEQKDIVLLESDNYKYVLLSLHNINECFIGAECPTPPSEDDLFRLKD